MKAQELIDAAIGENGVIAHAALDQLLGDERYNQAMDDVHQLLVATKSMKKGGKLNVTISYDQAMVLATYYATGRNLIYRVDEMLEKEENL